MSSDVVYSCVTCSKTVKGKQHYAICVSCSRRVHRKCYGQVLSNNHWTRIRQTFTCTECVAGSIGQKRQVVIEESMDITPHVSAYVPPTTVKYEIFIGASQKGGEFVTDSCGYAYGFYRDFQLSTSKLESSEVRFSRLRQISALLLHSQTNYKAWN
jgi:hypothetical protein